MLTLQSIVSYCIKWHLHDIGKKNLCCSQKKILSNIKTMCDALCLLCVCVSDAALHKKTWCSQGAHLPHEELQWGEQSRWEDGLFNPRCPELHCKNGQWLCGKFKIIPSDWNLYIISYLISAKPRSLLAKYEKHQRVFFFYTKCVEKSQILCPHHQ